MGAFFRREKKMNEIATVLVIEDDATIRGILRMTLSNAGFRHVKLAERGDAGLELAKQMRPAVILLDLMLPGIDGLTVCRKVRETPELADTKIVMLTAKSEDEDVVKGLELGADDYVTKPFSRQVLLARIRAVLRRQDATAGGRSLAGLQLDENGLCAKVGEKEIALTRTEFRILKLLAGHPGRTYTRQRIIDATQNEEKSITERTVDVQVVSLRRKLGEWSENIETIRGVGYRVKEQ